MITAGKKLNVNLKKEKHGKIRLTALENMVKDFKDTYMSIPPNNINSDRHSNLSSAPIV